MENTQNGLEKLFYDLLSIVSGNYSELYRVNAAHQSLQCRIYEDLALNTIIENIPKGTGTEHIKLEIIETQMLENVLLEQCRRSNLEHPLTKKIIIELTKRGSDKIEIIKSYNNLMK